MVRSKDIRNSILTRNWPYDRRNSNAGGKFQRNKRSKVKKIMTAITDGGDLKQLNEFLSQRKMKSLFHLIDSSGPMHCPLFTMRLSICDHADTIISQTIGLGRSKKIAKQAAAKHYLQSFFNKNEQISGASVIDHASTQPKSEPQAQTEEIELGNAVGALDQFCRTNGLEKPMYEYKMVLAMFHCVCKVNDLMHSGTAVKKKLAKHNAAHLVLQQLKIAENNCGSIKTEKHDYERSAYEASDVSDELDATNNYTNDDFVEMLDFSETDVQQNDLAIMEDVVSTETSHKLASIVKRYIEIYAEDLKCTPAEYLAAVNHWRHPCDMTELLSLWVMSTMQVKLQELLAADVQHMGTSVLKANNLLITEANSHALATYYEFCVWTPIHLPDTDNDNADYFMISTMDACGNNTIRKHTPQVGEAIVCHHSTKFRFRGSKQLKWNRFYLVTEWKRNTYNELDSMARIISTSVSKWDNDKIRRTLLHGLQVICNKTMDYDLIQCGVEWLRLLNFVTELSEVNRIFIENCLNTERVKQLLATFILSIKAEERHNARDCDERIYQELSDYLLTPIEQFISTE